jgi:hypothetical protein
LRLTEREREREREINKSISIKMDVCVYMCVCLGITLECLERFQPNLVCVRILCMFHIYILQGGWCGRQGIWMIHIVEEIKL